MQFTLETVTLENQFDLVTYSATHGNEHDSSYLPGRDFKLSEDYPSYLLKQGDQAIGAVCLMRTKRFLSINKGRFSIFHSVINKKEAYTQLLDAIRPHFQDLKSTYLFIPEQNREIASILSELGFEIERYSFVLERANTRINDVQIPEGFSVTHLESSDRQGITQFTDCLNEEFKELAGHTTNTTEDLLTWFEDESYLEGGLCLLKKGQEPVGTISLMRDLDNSMAGEILAFGILKEYRGRDLGRNLLKYGINFLIDKGLDPLILSVNGENRGAIRLYETEGFQLTESVVCYALDINGSE